VTGSVKLHKLALALPFIAALMLCLFLCRPGTRRLYPRVIKHLPDNVVRDNKPVVNREIFTESRERRVRPELPVEPDDFCTKLIRVFLFLIDKSGMAINKSGLALFQIFVFEDKNGLS
jgi:hypothetical protein